MPARKKSKYGCRTCRIRKTKCDETWPVCNRCSSTGRTCDGYGVWGGGGPPQKPLDLIASTETVYFEWYFRRSAIKLPGPFYSQAWTTMLFQASTTEPVVRHALLALGSAHREEVLSHNDLYTIQQYSKAVRCLQSPLIDQRATLLTCALLIYRDFLGGHYATGLMHLKHGLILLDQTASSQLDLWLVTHFTQLLVQAKMFGQLLDFPCENLLRPDKVTTTFRSTYHARRCLEQIMLRAFERQSNLQNEMLLWTQAHRKSMSMAESIKDILAYRLLQLQGFVATILTGTCTTFSEMKFDLYRPAFLNIISHSIELYQLSHSLSAHRDPEPSSPNSVSDGGWIAPLFFTAIKCRNHRIRNQALRMLQLLPHKEGIWDSRLAVAIAEHVIQAEEGDCYPHLKFDVMSVPTDEEMCYATLPEDRRVTSLKITLPNDKTGKLSLEYKHGNHLIQTDLDN